MSNFGAGFFVGDNFSFLNLAKLFKNGLIRDIIHGLVELARNDFLLKNGN